MKSTLYDHCFKIGSSQTIDEAHRSSRTQDINECYKAGNGIAFAADEEFRNGNAVNHDVNDAFKA